MKLHKTLLPAPTPSGNSSWKSLCDAGRSRASRVARLVCASRVARLDGSRGIYPPDVRPAVHPRRVATVETQGDTSNITTGLFGEPINRRYATRDLRAGLFRGITPPAT